MTPSALADADPPPSPPHAHDYLEAFETAGIEHGHAKLDDYLPPPGHPLRESLLPELIRIDLELGWQRGAPLPLDEYRRRYPEPFAHPDHLRELAFEEYRLRMQAGDRTTPAEYAERYGINTSDWPVVAATVVTPPRPPGAVDSLGDALLKAASLYRQHTRERLKGRRSGVHHEVFDELHRANPAQAERLAEAVTTMPKVGDEFLGFRLVAELGRGAFGRVFLAEQKELADRPVALKICADLEGETHSLAQLLHTNVMPIYSIHRIGPFQAACMPYYGSTTLADVLRAFKDVSVPVSGRELVTTLKNTKTIVSQTRSELLSSDGAKEQRGAPIVAADLPRPHVGSRVVLDRLERGTYVEAMLWIGSRLADGLAHAHERGILHRDLKPANVLLSEEGQPLLLDFNLAEDVKLRGGAAAARLGGTLPYMSPEQLSAMQGAAVSLDARSDIYSLGLILYELLTGTAPWPVPGGPVRPVVAAMADARQQPPPGLREHNPEVSPATEAIVLKCLHHDPQHRYQSARDLQEDLERQLSHQRLRHALEPSWRERRRKFARRHPRLCSSLVIGTAAALLLAAAAGLVGFQAQRLKRQAVLDQFHTFQDDARTVQVLLTAQHAERTPWEEAVTRGKQALEPYRVLDQERWHEGDGMRYLPAAEQGRLREEVGTVLFMMTRAEMLRPGSEDRPENLRQVLQWSRLAEECFAPRPPASVWDQRAEVLRRLGQLDEAKRASERAKDEQPATARDRLLEAREHVARGRFRQAFPLLQQATQEEPQSLMAWFLLARCHDDLGQDAQALACYNTCIALWPRQHRLYFNRGLAHLRLRDYAKAVADFNRSIDLEPNHHDAYFNRGLARQGLNQHAEAIEDYTTALEQGAPFTRIYFVRARARQKVNDLEGARRDRADGMRIEPTDEVSWVARGVARLGSEPARALADFDKALELNPRYRPALDNKAHVLAEVQGKTAEAVKVLDRIIELYPDHAAARSSRGVLWARLKKRTEAHQDAEEALIRSGDPSIQYQVAGIYALTSTTDPDDAREAFRLLSAALRRGYGLDLVGRDTDLDPIRNRPEFRRLVEAARALQHQAAER
jgi:serine/threonine protein kinase/Flp pilus assembly protein TadD